MPETIEKIILSNLIFNDYYSRKVLTYLKEEYFHNQTHLQTFILIKKHILKYNTLPTLQSLLIDLSSTPNVNEQISISCNDFINKLKPPSNIDNIWLIDQTEKFCKQKAIHNALKSSIDIFDKSQNGMEDADKIPEILKKALSVSFNPSIGHDYIQDSETRYDHYKEKLPSIPFDLEYMNLITDGGLIPGTLNIMIAMTGAGKTLFMTHCAANNISKGYNVLYITLEMSKYKIAERVDANLMNIPLSDLKEMPKDYFLKGFEKIRSMIPGKLIIEEFPTASASVADFRRLINNLYLRKNFKPDIIYVDYVNICRSARLSSGEGNSYSYIKAVAEELRGLAVEVGVPIVSASQLNRTGYNNNDVDLTNISESMGLPMTCDLILAMIVSEKLDQLGCVMFKQLKNRYNDPNFHKRFVVGIERSKMRLFDVDQEIVINDLELKA